MSAPTPATVLRLLPMNTFRLLLSVLLLCAAPAWAGSTRPAKQPRTSSAAPAREPLSPPPPANDMPTQASSQADELDFDLLESSVDAAAAVKVDPALEAKVARRRTMLRVHQGLGFALAAGMAGTTVVGQLNFEDRYRGGGDQGRYRGLHRGLVIGTTGLFATVGLLGLLAPEPYAKHGLRLDTATMHKVFMGLATAGMLTQVVLGLVTKGQEGQLSQVNLATAHQVVGYVTLGAVSAGAITLFF